MTLPVDVVQRGPQAVQIYREAIAQGTAPKMAEMFAMRQAPRGMTDSTYFAGIYGGLAKQWGPEEALEIRADSIKNYGVDPGNDCIYMPQLVPIGKKSGHPAAFVKMSDGVAGLKDRYRQQNKESELLGVKAVQMPPPAVVDVAPDLVREEVKNRIKMDPGLKERDQRELAEQVREELSPGLPE